MTVPPVAPTDAFLGITPTGEGPISACLVGENPLWTEYLLRQCDDPSRKCKSAISLHQSDELLSADSNQVGKILHGPVRVPVNKCRVDRVCYPVAARQSSSSYDDPIVF